MNHLQIYKLKQERILGMIKTTWGKNCSSERTEDNDKLCLFGLHFREENGDKLLHLSRSVTDRKKLEDPGLVPKGLFHLMELDFNNSNIVVEHSLKAQDIKDQ